MTDDADPLRALIAKWQTEAALLSKPDTPSHWHFAAAKLEACAEELEALLSAPVASAERKAILMKIWSCTVGDVDAALLPPGADLPMRRAVAAAYRRLTGHEPRYLFSGWGAELTDAQLAVVRELPSAPVASPEEEPKQP